MDYIKTINYFENLISQSINQGFLKRHIDEPVIDKHQILALNEITKYEKDYEHLIHTTMLVHIALNTHDKIRSDHQLDKNIKQQQLTVLAGDYFSGIYYYILAQHHNLPFIRLLADTINELTQQKITVFYQQYDDSLLFLEDYIHIHTGLVSKVAQYTNHEGDVHFLSYWLMLKKIEQEISYLYEGKGSFFQNLLINNVSIEDAFAPLETKLWQLHAYLTLEVEKHQTSQLFSTLNPSMDLYRVTKITVDVEEGLSK